MQHRLLPVARFQAALLRYCRIRVFASKGVCCSTSTPQGARFLAPSEKATSVLASLLAQQRRPRDCLCLNGEVGSGKSAFSRAYIRAVEENDFMPVPSPTYLLQNVYEYDDGPWVYHYDLYRLHSQVDLQRLDLRESLKTGVSLIEWPACLGEMTPGDRLDVDIGLVQPAVEEAALKVGLVSAVVGVVGDGNGGAYEDHRWRCITLTPHGRHWRRVIQGIVGRLSDQEATGTPQGKGLIRVSEELEKALGMVS